MNRDNLSKGRERYTFVCTRICSTPLDAKDNMEIAGISKFLAHDKEVNDTRRQSRMVDQ